MIYVNNCWPEILDFQQVLRKFSEKVCCNRIIKLLSCEYSTNMSNIPFFPKKKSLIDYKLVKKDVEKIIKNCSLSVLDTIFIVSFFFAGVQGQLFTGVVLMPTGIYLKTLERENKKNQEEIDLLKKREKLLEEKQLNLQDFIVKTTQEVKKIKEQKADNREKVDHKKQVHVSIDWANFSQSMKKLNLDIDLEKIKAYFSQIAKQYDGLQLHIYAGNSPGIKTSLTKAQKWGYDLHYLPICSSKITGDDIDLALNLLENVNSGDKVFLFSGDGDYLPLAKRLLAKGVSFTLVTCDSAGNHNWDLVFKNNPNFMKIDLNRMIKHI